MRLFVNRTARAIVEAYLEEAVAKRVKTPEIAKIFVGLAPPKLTHLFGIQYRVLGVVPVIVPFEFSRFMKAGAPARRRMLLDALHRGVLETCDAFKINKTPFLGIPAEVERRGMVYRKALEKPRWTRRRSRCAQVCLFGDIDCGQMQLCVVDKADGAVRAKCLRRRGWLWMVPVLDHWSVRWRSENVLSVWCRQTRGLRRKTCVFKGIDVRKLPLVAKTSAKRPSFSELIVRL